MENNPLFQWVISLLQNNNIKAFYNSSLWLTKREEALDRDHNECQKCKAKGLYKTAECVHHIKHVKKYPSLALELSNLMSLCNSCHDEEHPEKLRKYKPKEQLNIERW